MTIKSIVNDFKAFDYQNKCYGKSVDDTLDNLSFWVYFWLCQWGRELICRLRGHDWYDAGYATPDSGCIQMSCNRCGYCSETHWLY